MNVVWGALIVVVVTASTVIRHVVGAPSGAEGELLQRR